MSRYTTASIVFYAFTVGFAIGGFALAATKHYSEGAWMGAAAVLFGILALAFGYASTKTFKTHKQGEAK
jgi:hypothetical protein